MTQSPGCLRRVQIWIFLFPQCSSLLKCCCSWCSLFFREKQILFCCSTGAETVRRDTISLWDGDRARAGQDNYLLGLFYTQLLHVKSEWGNYKVNVGTLSNYFKLCYHLYLSAELPILQEYVLLKVLAPLLQGKSTAWCNGAEVLSEIKQVGILQPSFKQFWNSALFPVPDLSFYFNDLAN